MPLTLDSLKKLYVHELKDLHSAEAQISEALPKMIDAASDDELTKAFKHHQKETDRHLERLEKIFSALDFAPKGHRCQGMEGLLKEGSSAFEIEDHAVRDAALVAAAQRVEHYEMAGYGTAKAFAIKLGEHDAANLLQETLDEEAHADEKLSRLAERYLNFEAMVAG